MIEVRIDNSTDILENSIPQEVLQIFLKDHTTSKEEEEHTILWATKDYEHLGEGYQEEGEITYERICNNDIIIPRVPKIGVSQLVRLISNFMPSMD